MDVVHLTPHLRRRVLKLNAEDRIALRHEIDRSLISPVNQRQERMESLVRIMGEIVQLDIRTRSRRTCFVRARCVLCVVLKMEGYNQHEIGETLGLNHSTISHCEKIMRKALEFPNIYPDYISLYNQYTNAIL